MSKGTRNVLLGTCLAVFAGGTAWAQPDPSSDPGASPDPSAGAQPPVTTPVTEEPVASRYPRSVIDRPLTFPKGLAAVGADVATSTSNFADPASIRVLAGYGITDDFEVNFGHYQFPTNDAGKGDLDIGIGYKLLRGAAGGKLELIARASTGYSLAAEQMKPLLLGVHAQYNATPKLAIYTFPGAAPGSQLSIAVAGDPKPITFGLPVGVAYQATKTVWLQLDTTLATFNISKSANSYIFDTATPVAVTGIINVLPELDLLAQVFSLNLTPPDPIKVADTMGVLVGARYYIGRL